MSEEAELKRIGAKPVSNSGRGVFAKGDGKMPGGITVDVKEYEKSFSLSKQVWTKICTDAAKNGNDIPALNVVLGSGNNRTRLWVVHEDMFMEMYESWVKAHG